MTLTREGIWSQIIKVLNDYVIKVSRKDYWDHILLFTSLSFPFHVDLTDKNSLEKNFIGLDKYFDIMYFMPPIIKYINSHDENIIIFN